MRDLKKEKLTPTLLCHLQELVTKNTLDNPSAAGRFRMESEPVHVVDVLGEILYTPPPADSIEKRIEEVCNFANAKSKPFVHPVVKGIALHFAIGFIHPFVDGNGRTARAIFYWYMLKNGYWMFEYLPISRIIVAAPAKYARAYLYTEGGGDLTYFNNYHLKVVMRAIKELHDYLEIQQKKSMEAQKILEGFPDLNLRQRMLIQDALRHPAHEWTVSEHAGKYRVTYNTARADLLKVDKLALLVKSKNGKKSIFPPAPKL